MKGVFNFSDFLNLNCLNTCLYMYTEVDIYMACHLKTILLDCALIGAQAVIGSNMVSMVVFISADKNILVLPVDSAM